MDQTGHFPLKRDWALAELNHRYVKDIIIAVYVIYLLKWLASYKWATFKPRALAEWLFHWLSPHQLPASLEFKITIRRRAFPWDMTLGHDT